MADLATLKIAVDSTDTRRAERDLNALSATGAKAEQAFAKMGAVFAAMATALAGMKAFWDTNEEFQRLGASLVTVTGSTEKANRAFKMLQGLAQNTPYELSQVTQAFIDLKTRGMDASAKSITSYGDMASSFGRSLEDTIRAISGVAMGETEAIKSFGVQARAQGDMVALTFRGQTELVKRSMSAVEDYFKRLADANFGGGMARQMGTLGGALSNLKDQIAATFFSVGNAGISDQLISGIKGLTQAIADATPALVSMATGAVNAFTMASAAVQKYYRVVQVLIALPIAQWILGMSGSLVALAAPMVRQIALTIALDLATIKYATGAGIATAATGLLAGAMSILLSPVAILAAAMMGLVLIYDKLTEAQDRQFAYIKQREAYANNIAEPYIQASNAVKDLIDENKRLEAVLGGSKKVEDRVFSGQGESLIKAARDKGNAEDVKAAREMAKMLDEQTEKNRKLKQALENKNKALLEGTKEIERQNKVVQDLRNKYADLGATELQMMYNQIAAQGLTGSRRDEALELARKISLKKTMLEIEKEQKRVEDERERNARENGLRLLLDAEDSRSREMQDRLTGERRYNPEMAYEYELKQIERLKLSQESFKKAMFDLRYQFSDTFRVLADGMMNFGDNLARSFGAWIARMEGAKFVFKDLVRSMMADIATMFAQEAMRKMVLWALGSVSNYWGGFGGSGGGGNTTWTGGAIRPSSGVANGGGAVTNSVVVNVNASTGQVDAQGQGRGSTGDLSKLGDMIGNRVREVMVNEMRPGGLLSPA